MNPGRTAGAEPLLVRGAQFGEDEAGRMGHLDDGQARTASPEEKLALWQRAVTLLVTAGRALRTASADA